MPPRGLLLHMLRPAPQIHPHENLRNIDATTLLTDPHEFGFDTPRRRNQLLAVQQLVQLFPIGVQPMLVDLAHTEVVLGAGEDNDEAMMSVTGADHVASGTNGNE